MDENCRYLIKQVSRPSGDESSCFEVKLKRAGNGSLFEVKTHEKDAKGSIKNVCVDEATGVGDLFLISLLLFRSAFF
jgi:hypothetical protein